MIVRLTGTLVEISSTSVVIDVAGVGFELGVSTQTLSMLPAVSTPGVALYTRLLVREDAMDLYGFLTREERALFDKLRGISGVGPKLALAVLSTFSPAALAEVVAAQDVSRMSTVSGVGKKKAGRLLMELSDAFNKDFELKDLIASTLSVTQSETSASPNSIASEAREALMSMGFSAKEAELAISGYDDAAVSTIEQLLSYALRRLGSGI